MAEINWTVQSVEDIENIAEFISKDSENYARNQVLSFFEAVKILGNNPEAGRIVPELSNNKIRELIVDAYRIIYHLASREKIEILTVHHSYRLLNKNAFSRRKRK